MYVYRMPGYPAKCTTVTNIQIIAGASNYVLTDENTRQVKTVPFSRVTPHDNEAVDLAMIYLDDDEFNIDPHTVDEADVTDTAPSVNDIYRAAGWGRTSFSKIRIIINSYVIQ